MKWSVVITLIVETYWFKEDHKLNILLLDKVSLYSLVVNYKIFL